MTPLTDAEREELAALLATGNPLPEKWLHRLFPNGRKAESVGKEYRLVYDGKLTREEVLAQTAAAPWQLVRSFCAGARNEGSRTGRKVAGLPALPRLWERAYYVRYSARLTRHYFSPREASNGNFHQRRYSALAGPRQFLGVG